MNGTDSLSTALHELAAVAGDEPASAAAVHARVRRQRHRRRVVWVGTASATAAASLVGGGLIASATHRASPVATSGAPAASPTLPACPEPTRRPPVDDPGPPAIGQQLSSAARVVGHGTATAVTVEVVAGPLAGTRVTLSVTAATKVLLASPLAATGEVPITADQLRDGQEMKFAATRTAETTYVVGELHAAPLNPPGGAVALGGATAGGATAGAATEGKTATGVTPDTVAAGAIDSTKANAVPNDGSGAAKPNAAPPKPPAVGDVVKVGGAVTASTPTSLTVNAARGNVIGMVTFVLGCQPAPLRPGDQVTVVGTVTGLRTYEATTVILEPPAASPAVSKG